MHGEVFYKPFFGLLMDQLVEMPDARFFRRAARDGRALGFVLGIKGTKMLKMYFSLFVVAQ
jgi:hypothetical protein